MDPLCIHVGIHCWMDLKWIFIRSRFVWFQFESCCAHVGLVCNHSALVFVHDGFVFGFVLIHVGIAAMCFIVINAFLREIVLAVLA